MDLNLLTVDILLCRNSLTCHVLQSENYKTAVNVSIFRRTLLPYSKTGRQLPLGNGQVKYN